MKNSCSFVSIRVASQTKKNKPMNNSGENNKLNVLYETDDNNYGVP